MILNKSLLISILCLVDGLRGLSIPPRTRSHMMRYSLLNKLDNDGGIEKLMDTRFPYITETQDSRRPNIIGLKKKLASAFSMISTSTKLSFLGSCFLLPAGFYLIVTERKGGGMFNSYAISMTLYLVSSSFYTLGGLLDCRNILLPNREKVRFTIFHRAELILALASVMGSLTFLVGTLLLSQSHAAKQNLGLSFYVTSSICNVVGNLLQIRNLHREFLLQKFGVFIAPATGEGMLESQVVYIEDVQKKWTGDDTDYIYVSKRNAILMSFCGSFFALLGCIFFSSRLFFLSGVLLTMSSLKQLWIEIKFPISCLVLI